MFSDPDIDKMALSVRGVGKCYHIYAKPKDRLKQTLWRGRRCFYQEFWALRDVTFDVQRGECLGIIGRNGSGKSTLLQVIAGTLVPTEGQAVIRGRVGALLELGSGFDPNFTGRENVFMQGAILGFSPSDIEARFDEIAAFADIGDFIHQPVKFYSSGMFVRLAFAAQILMEPDILVVDEVLAVGDAAFQRRCYRRLNKIRANGASILFVSHSLELVRTVCDRAIYLERGKPKALGTASSVCDGYLADLLAEQMSENDYADQPAKDTASSQRKVPTEEVVLDRFDSGAPGNKVIQGNRAIDVIEADISRNDTQYSYCREGDRLKVRARLKVSQSIPVFLFGVLIRDRYGNDIFGSSTPSSDLGVPAGVRPGDVLHVEMTIKCDIRPDTYFITLGVQAHEFSDLFFYGHDVLQFTVEPPIGQNLMLKGGVARLEHSVSACLVKAESQEVRS